jgi:hypothetical protein
LGRAELGLDERFEHGEYWRDKGERTYRVMMRVKIESTRAEVHAIR